MKMKKEYFGGKSQNFEKKIEFFYYISTSILK
jgi:hypothetical protein